VTDWHEIEDLDRRGVPRPDGTPLGNLRHTLAVYAKVPDDAVVMTATRHVYEQGRVTGLSLGDLRALLAMIDSQAPSDWSFERSPERSSRQVRDPVGECASDGSGQTQ
jgi:hypothetical protein